MPLVPISREMHAGKRFKPVHSYAFARNLSVVRILANEAGLVAENYPIAFVKENDAVVPVAVLGLGKEENLFVSEQGQWLGLYIPAVLRRFPFNMSKAKEGSDSKTLTLLIDDSCLSDSEGEPLFGPDEGEPKGPVARAIQFLTEIAVQDARTATLVKALVDAELLEPLPLQVTRSGNQPVNLTGLQVISEAKLNALPDARFLEFRRSGVLPLIYAHLVSIGQFGRLRALANARATPKSQR